MRVVNNSLYLGIVIILASCLSHREILIPTNNKGGYKIVSLKNNSNVNPNEVYLFGKVFDVKTKKPINYANLRTGCFSTSANVNGEYSFKIRKSDNIYLEVFSILGYKNIQTNLFKLNNKNSININFFLTEDDRPLINCEGKK